MSDRETKALADALHLTRHEHATLWAVTDGCGCLDLARFLVARLRKVGVVLTIEEEPALPKEKGIFVR